MMGQNGKQTDSSLHKLQIFSGAQLETIPHFV